jgi:hypothetical protein
MRYNARAAPDPQAWLELDEQERIDLIIKYHRRNRQPMGENPRAHCAVHVAVEKRPPSDGYHKDAPRNPGNDRGTA